MDAESGSASVLVVSPGRRTLTERRVMRVPLERFSRALARRQAEDHTGMYRTNAGIAAMAGVGRDTVSRFLGGGPVDLVAARRLLAVVGLRLADVAVPVDVT